MSSPVEPPPLHSALGVGTKWTLGDGRSESGLQLHSALV